MSNKFYRNAAILLSVTITACGSMNKPSKEQVAEALRDSTVKVNLVDQPIALSEKTKAQGVGNFAASSVIGSIAASGSGATSIQGMQANMNIAQSFSGQLADALPDSYKIEHGKGADTWKKGTDLF